MNIYKRLAEGECIINDTQHFDQFKTPDQNLPSFKTSTLYPFAWLFVRPGKAEINQS